MMQKKSVFEIVAKEIKDEMESIGISPCKSNVHLI